MNEFFGLGFLLENGVSPRGILHIGAHYGEEASHYRGFVGDNVTWVEAHPDFAAKLKANPELGGQRAHEACLFDSDGEEVEFFVTKDEYASSLFRPAYHTVQNPHAPVTHSIKVSTVTWGFFYNSLSAEDRGVIDGANILVLDTQGSELPILRSMESILGQFDAIVTEYSSVEFYHGGTRLTELDSFLETDWVRVYPDDSMTEALFHADALYLRPN